jgi:hypothetical protein
MKPRQCTCDSGNIGEEQFDARGIYLCITCDECHEGKMKRYRPEVRTDFNYEADEPIEPEE